jgi:hypothetical protein
MPKYYCGYCGGKALPVYIGDSISRYEHVRLSKCVGGYDLVAAGGVKRYVQLEAIFGEITRLPGRLGAWSVRQIGQAAM